MGNKTVINVKVDKETKKQAQKAAKELGLPLSTIVNSYLREFVQEKRIVFSDHPVPNARTRKILVAALKDAKEGKNFSPVFDNAEDAIAYLDKS